MQNTSGETIDYYCWRIERNEWFQSFQEIVNKKRHRSGWLIGLLHSKKITFYFYVCEFYSVPRRQTKLDKLFSSTYYIPKNLSKNKRNRPINCSTTSILHIWQCVTATISFRHPHNIDYWSVPSIRMSLVLTYTDSRSQPCWTLKHHTGKKSYLRWTS